MANYNDVKIWFSAVRNEFQGVGLSVFNKFVVPFDFDEIDLRKINHSMALVGGRGTGKTVFLRYCSHWTQFDKKRTNVSNVDLESIILYWKPDTAFFRAIKPEIFGKQVAKNFFLTLASFEIVLEFISAIENIGNHFPEIERDVFSDSIFWGGVSNILGKKVENVEAFRETFNLEIYNLQTNPSVINTLSNPKSALELLVKRVRIICSDSLGRTTFKVFIDEFENLSNQQQTWMNDFRKYSNSNISWNVAYKEFSEVSTDTSGDEKLQGTDDYILVKMLNKGKIGDKDYEIMCAEIVLNILLQKGELKTQISELSSVFLCNDNNLGLRRSSEYRKKINFEIRRLFPSPSIQKLCEIACKNTTVSKKIISNFKQVGYTEDIAKMVIAFAPQVAISHTTIFHHKNFKKDIEKEKSRLLSYVENIKGGKKSLDAAFKTKVDTYVFHSLFSLNLDNSYINIPVYSGFSRFCKISSRSIRSLILLVYGTAKLTKNEDIVFDSIEEIEPFNIDNMQLSAITTSKEAIEEIINFTPNGIKLSVLTNRIGSLFKLSYKVLGQSEPELTHFMIKENYRDFTKENQQIISSAKTWKILIEENATKDRSVQGNSFSEYILSPLYAPYFGISYRKTRRYEFSIAEFEDICNTSEEETKNYALLREKMESLGNTSAVLTSIKGKQDQRSLDLK